MDIYHCDEGEVHKIYEHILKRCTRMIYGFSYFALEHWIFLDMI